MGERSSRRARSTLKLSHPQCHSSSCLTSPPTYRNAASTTFLDGSVPIDRLLAIMTRIRLALAKPGCREWPDREGYASKALHAASGTNEQRTDGQPTNHNARPVPRGQQQQQQRGSESIWGPTCPVNGPALAAFLGRLAHTGPEPVSPFSAPPRFACRRSLFGGSLDRVCGPSRLRSWVLLASRCCTS
ncbi:hypothetical protein BC567DRAFT_231529 [Phyllosticta citribraziliensis]